MATSSTGVRDFLLPDLGEGLTEGEVASWLVTVGDVVAVDQPVAEIETAKAVVEVPSPFAGVVVARHAEIGEEIQVGQPLLSIDTQQGTDGAGATAATAALPSRAVAPASAPGDTDVSDMVPRPGGPAGDGPAGSGSADEGSGSVLVGYGTQGGSRPRRRRAGAPSPSGDTPEPPDGHGRPLAKPPVRKMASDLGVNLSDVVPTGEGGVITRDDVRAAAGAREAHETPASPPLPGDRRVPLTKMRRTIAAQMVRSRAEIPEATTWVDCDATALLAARGDINSREGGSVSPLAFVMRACVVGLRRYPQLNASLDVEAGEIVLHRDIRLGFAAHTERGLVVPVIADAATKSILDIAAELNDLAEQARAGTLRPGQMSGSTFTLSNYGSFGVDGGAPIINHPEAAILGMGRISPKAWVHNGAVAVRQVVQLSITFDHRICDGGEAAGFLRFVADCVESPALLLAHL